MASALLVDVQLGAAHSSAARASPAPVLVLTCGSYARALLSTPPFRKCRPLVIDGVVGKLARAAIACLLRRG